MQDDAITNKLNAVAAITIVRTGGILRQDERKIVPESFRKESAKGAVAYQQPFTGERVGLCFYTVEIQASGHLNVSFPQATRGGGFNMGKYYVVPFTNEQLRKFLRHEFTLRVNQVIFESMIRLKEQPERECDVVSLEVYLCYPSASKAPKLQEYGQHSAIYFFNEGYMRLLEDIGLKVDVDKIIPAEELPKGLEKAQSGRYLPK